MARRLENLIRYKHHTDNNLLVDLTQDDGVIRAWIRDLLQKIYGDQFQNFDLAFRDQAGDHWIQPTLTIKQAFNYARRRLNGALSVYLYVWPQLGLKWIKTEEDQKVFDGH